MNCPHCTATSTKERAKKTKRGSATFFCPKCQHVFNERTGTPFPSLEFPPDVVLLAVLWRLRYQLSLRDVAELFLARGFPFTPEAIRDWEARFTPLITEQLRTKRRGQAGASWFVDETSLKVHGKWCYSRSGDDEWPHFLSAGPTRNNGQQWRASNEYISQYWAGARSPWHQTAVLSHAWLWNR